MDPQSWCRGQANLFPSTPSWFVPGLRGGWGRGDKCKHTGLRRPASKQFSDGHEDQPICLWEEASESHPLGSLACGHKQSCCAPTAERFLRDPRRFHLPHLPASQQPPERCPVWAGWGDGGASSARPWLTQSLPRAAGSYQHGGDDEGPVRQRVGDIRASAFGDLRDVEPLRRTPHPNLDGQTDGEKGLSPQTANKAIISFPFLVSIVVTADRL